jgi:hypothetical protein
MAPRLTSKVVTLSLLLVAALMLLAVAPASAQGPPCFPFVKRLLMFIYGCKEPGPATCAVYCQWADPTFRDDCIRDCAASCSPNPCASCEAFVTRYAKAFCGGGK